MFNVQCSMFNSQWLIFPFSFPRSCVGTVFRTQETTMIQAVLFDLDNTLLDRDAAFRRVYSRFIS